MTLVNVKVASRSVSLYCHPHKFIWVALVAQCFFMSIAKKKKAHLMASRLNLGGSLLVKNMSFDGLGKLYCACN